MNHELLLQRIENRKSERPGREILLDHSVTGNRNVTVRIGTVDDKNCPTTAYVCVTFWVGLKNQPKEHSEEFGRRITREYSKELDAIYRKNLVPVLLKHPMFPFPEDNIYIKDFPENIAYNGKRCFTLVELNLHTANCLHGIEKKYPLRTSGDTELFDRLVEMAKIITTSDLLSGRKSFTIHKRKK